MDDIKEVNFPSSFILSSLLSQYLGLNLTFIVYIYIYIYINNLTFILQEEKTLLTKYLTITLSFFLNKTSSNILYSLVVIRDKGITWPKVH